MFVEQQGVTEPPVVDHAFIGVLRNLYGMRLTVESKHKLRDEQKFESLERLQEQIQRDIASAKEYFRGIGRTGDA